MAKKVYPRKHFYMDEESLKCLTLLSRKYKKTDSELVRDMLKKRASLKTLKHLEREIETNKKALLLISRLPGNLNQISHKLNEGTFNFDEYKFYEMVEDLKDEIKELRLELKWNTRLLEEIM